MSNHEFDKEDTEEIHELMENNNLDFEDATEVVHTMNEYDVDVDDAIEINHLVEHKNGKGGYFIGLLFTIGIIWAISSLFGSKKEDSSAIQEHPNYAAYKESKDCSDLEPDNPFDEGSGHYAGFQWGEEGNYCDGNSDSFIEGCEEYQLQENAYDECISSE